MHLEVPMNGPLCYALRLVLAAMLMMVAANKVSSRCIKQPIETALNQAFQRIGGLDKPLAQASNK